MNLIGKPKNIFLSGAFLFHAKVIRREGAKGGKILTGLQQGCANDGEDLLTRII
jgi:hypothetical protein